MNPVKWLRLVVLVLMLGAMFAPSPAFAAKKKKTEPEGLVLVPPADDPPEPGASGTVTDQCDWDRYGTYYTGEATVSCRGLTPGNQYDVQFLVRHWIPSPGDASWEWYVCETRRVAADRKGRLTTQLSYGGDVVSGGNGVWDVCVQNDQGNFVLLGRYDPPSWCWECPYWY
jgi:hypothetical protein